MQLTMDYLNKIGVCAKFKRWFKNQSETEGLMIVKKLCKKSEQNRIKNKFYENSLEWANRIICRMLNKKNKLRYAICAAELVLPIFEDEKPNDKRPRNAVEAVKNYLENPTEENKKTSTNKAADAADAADAAESIKIYKAAEAAAYAAYAAAYADYAAAEAAADAAANSAYADAAAEAAIKKRKYVQLKILSYGVKLLESQENK